MQNEQSLLFTFGFSTECGKISTFSERLFSLCGVLFIGVETETLGMFRNQKVLGGMRVLSIISLVITQSPMVDI